MGLFRRKKNRAKELDATFARLAGELRQVESQEDHKKRQRKIIESCEQIIETTKEIEEQKAERRILDNYLADIATIENLPEKEHKDLLDVAGNIVKLDKAKKAYLNSERKIDEGRFAFFQEIQDDIVPVVQKMQSNETYQRALKKDMAYLEGEKMQWSILKEDIKAEEKTLKHLLIGLFVAFSVVACVFIAVGSKYRLNMSLSWIVLIFFVVLGTVLILQRLQIDKKDLKQSEVNLNYAVELLNKTKVKYVNITNSLDYSYEKYNVGSSADLSYQWERYVEAVREDEKFARNNEDYEFFTARLLRILKGLNLNDIKIWTSQVKAIVNTAEMDQVKNELSIRKQKITESIDYNISLVKNERKEIDKMMKAEKEYLPEIQEIIKSVDKLCENKF
ncbi:MAG: hypothetical protein MJ110_03700 [Lachnospiraceae bacterium]|nr:hypothetical protein [Lachnospiraceae bacterium]